MELSDTSFGGTKVPWNSMEYSMELSDVIWRHQSSMEYSMEFHGTKWFVIWRHQSSMEFHGIFHGIPWNTCVICNGALLIPWNLMELGVFYDFLFGDSRIPLNFVEIYIFNIFWKPRVTGHKMTISKFHGTKWYFIWRHQSSMEFHGMFHGIPWNWVICHLAAPEFHGIPWNIPWNSMELIDISFGGTRVPWNILWNSIKHLCHL